MTKRSFKFYLVGGGLLFGCQGDHKLVPCSSAMEVAFQSPTTGASFAQAFPIPGIATVNDLCGRSVEEAEFILSSNVDAQLDGEWEMISEDEFHYTGQDILSLGEHILTLKVIGSAGNQGEDTVDIEIVENLPPTIEMLAPDLNGIHSSTTETAQVTISVADPEEPPESLILSWTIDDENVPEGPLNATEEGGASFTLQREEGCYTITATVTDAMGQSASVSGDILFSDDPEFIQSHTYRRDSDGDSWGSEDTDFIACDQPEDAVPWTEVGDCDDDDDSIYPGAADYCDDGIDNDCNIETPLNCSPLGPTSIGTAGALINGVNNAFIGVGMKNVGDFNNDGFDDLFIGSYVNSEMFFIPGPLSGLKDLSNANTYDCRIQTDTNNVQFGKFISGDDNDFDGDGIPDALISAIEWREGNSIPRGAIYLLFGEDSGGSDLCGGEWIIDDHLMTNGHTTGLRSVRLEGNAMNTKTGSGSKFIPDTDGDGLNDIIVGAWSNDEIVNDSGAVFLIQSSDYGLLSQNAIIDDVAHLRLSGGTQEAKIGISNAGADLDGDGIGDLIISRQNGPTGLNRGMVQVIYGRDIPIAQSLQLIDSMANLTFHGVADGDKANNINVAGDLDGDGDDEIFIGASGANDNSGRIYAVPGFYETSASYELNESFNPATSPNAQIAIAYEGQNGEGVSGMINAGDINNDSYTDWLIGARLNSEAAHEGGAAYLLYGGPHAWGNFWDSDGNPTNATIVPFNEAANSQNAAVIHGETPNAKFGTLIDGGDLSGDGIDDLIIGGNTPNNTIYIFFGGGT